MASNESMFHAAFTEKSVFNQFSDQQSKQMQQFQHALTIPTSTFTNTPFPHLSVRASLSTDNTIGLTMGILTFALGVLTVTFAWALWLLKH
jgi:hypothetical protein